MNAPLSSILALSLVFALALPAVAADLPLASEPGGGGAHAPVCAAPGPTAPAGLPNPNCCESLFCSICCQKDESPVCSWLSCYCRRKADPPPTDPIIIPIVA